MIVSGGIAFIWVDPARAAAGAGPRCTGRWRFMIGAAVFSALLAPRLVGRREPSSVACNDVLGFLAVAAAVGAGFA